MANDDGKPAWFDTLKGCQDLGELLRELRGRAADFPPHLASFLAR